MSNVGGLSAWVNVCKGFAGGSPDPGLKDLFVKVSVLGVCLDLPEMERYLQRHCRWSGGRRSSRVGASVTACG
jgi:hypothetical protein